ncbi:MAG: hypothetical protein AB7Q17_09585 [Phycisphaerae bacterium]
MTLTRTVVALALLLVVMVTVVILRAETTRLGHDIAQLDARADTLVDQIREQELELTRLRNPELIRARVGELRLRGEAAPSKPAAPARSAATPKPAAASRSNPNQPPAAREQPAPPRVRRD